MLTVSRRGKYPPGSCAGAIGIGPTPRGDRPVGPRLNELIHRARRYRNWKNDEVDFASRIPGKGYGTLPWVDDETHPNLVMVYIDAQHDYLYDRVYLLGSLVVGYERGKPHPNRRRVIVRLAPHPPSSHETEGELLSEWVDATIRAVVGCGTGRQR